MSVVAVIKLSLQNPSLAFYKLAGVGFCFFKCPVTLKTKSLKSLMVEAGAIATYKSSVRVVSLSQTQNLIRQRAVIYDLTDNKGCLERSVGEKSI